LNLCLVLSGILISCVEDNKINRLKYPNNEPRSLETSTGVTLNFSDLGESKLLLKAPKLIKLMADQEQLIMECPEGLELIFYDSLMKVESVLVADYGKLFSNEQQLFVRENVVFNNRNLDTLFAEELEIDFAKDSVYSEKLVTFSNKEGRITGKTLKANSNFTYFQMTDISQSHVNYDL
jgi:LPS export ABC transporter protein LptC